MTTGIITASCLPKAEQTNPIYYPTDKFYPYHKTTLYALLQKIRLSGRGETRLGLTPSAAAPSRNYLSRGSTKAGADRRKDKITNQGAL